GKLAAAGIFGSIIFFGLGHLNATLHNAPPPPIQSAPAAQAGTRGSVPPVPTIAPAPIVAPIEAPPLPTPRPAQAGDEATACAVIRYLAPMVSDNQKRLFSKDLTSAQRTAAA